MPHPDEPYRDTSADGFGNNLESAFLRNFGFFWRFVMAVGPLHRAANRLVIDRAAKRTRTRPSPLGSRPIGGDPANEIAPYTSWDQLTDRDWFCRHLPIPTKPPTEPDIAVVSKLWEVRPSGAKLSGKSSLVFMSFAQWFTDGFLMTDQHDRRRTHTSHHIDFNPLYGLTTQQTDALRLRSDAAGRRGRLKSETGKDGEEYAPRYFDEEGAVRPEFAALRPPVRLGEYLAQLPDDAARASVKAGIFAFGGERANAIPYTAALNTLFLREHNRIAGIVEKEYGFDDEQTFQIGRNVTSAILLKLVVEDYVNHIAPYHLKLMADPSVAWDATWNRPNWIPIEFNILYRWHSLCPEEYHITTPPTPGTALLFNNALMTGIGLGQTFDRASKQASWELGLFNTPSFLQHVEVASLLQARQHRLGTYNDYRKAYGYGPVTSFDQISSDPTVRKALKQLYEHPDKLEFYIGILAEDVAPNSALPSLIGRMVAHDAFSLALTNPLLSEHVWQNEATFTPMGKAIIAETDTLQALLDRNTAGDKGYLATMSTPRRDV